MKSVFKNAATFVCIAFAGASYGAPKTQKTDGITAPTTWSAFSFSLPPEFAPRIKWKGIEYLKFSPGMFDKNSKEFMTYVAFFNLETNLLLSEATVRSTVLEYYQDLAKFESKGGITDFSEFNVEKKSQLHGAKVKNATSYGYELDWIDPFATNEMQKLQIDVHIIKAEQSANKTCMLWLISPTYSRNLKVLDKILESARCLP